MLKTYLDGLVARYEQTSFIQDDPISIPHGFDDPRDQEVIGLYAALLAWGQRRTILNKMVELYGRTQEMHVSLDPESDESELWEMQKPSVAHGTLRDRLDFIGLWTYSAERSYAYIWKFGGIQRFYLSW